MQTLRFFSILSLLALSLTACATMSQADYEALEYATQCQAAPYLCAPNGPAHNYHELYALQWGPAYYAEPGGYRGAFPHRVTCTTTSSGGRYYANSTTTCY